MHNSLDVLSESLDLKIQVLKEIEEYNEQQRQAFESGEPDMDTFDSAIEKKEELINKIERLDDGFEAMFASLKEELDQNRDKYADRIKELQEKVALVTELSVSVQASEARNKKLIEQYFAKKKQGIKQGRVGSRAAFDYYKNMSGMNVAGPNYMDSKK